MNLHAEAGPVEASLLEGLPALVSRAAHDLNNSLARILGKAELALMLGDESRYRQSLEEVVEAGQSARVLVSDLQRFVAWCRATDESIVAADVVSLASRLAHRTCRKLGLQLTSAKGADAIEPAAAAAGSLACLALLQAAHEVFDLDDPRGETWTLGLASRGDGVLALSVRSDEPGPLLTRLADALGVERANASLAAVGGRAVPDDGGLRVEVALERP